MRTVVRGIVDFIAGDDIRIAVAVMLLLGVAAGLERLDVAAWWVLPIGVPVAVWSSLVRARRLAR